MGNFDPWFWFRKWLTQGSNFEEISGVFPYPNGSCNKIGFHIELQINAIGIRWFLLALPPKNRTCEFPRIWLKWLRLKDSRPATPYQRKLWRFAHPERGTNRSRLVRRASLLQSLLLAYRLEPSFNRDCSSLLGAFFRHPRSKSAPAKIS